MERSDIDNVWSDQFMWERHAKWVGERCQKKWKDEYVNEGKFVNAMLARIRKGRTVTRMGPIAVGLGVEEH